MTSASLRVAVIGGGIIGVSSAVHLARLGARVTLLTEHGVANEASGRSLAWLNSARFRSSEYHRLRMIGIDRYRTLAARHPDAKWLRFDGGLTWDADDASNKIADAFAHETRVGYDALHISADQIDAVTPGLDARVVTPQGAIFNPGEGWVDLPSLISILLDEFRSRGGQIALDAGDVSVDVNGGRVKGVVTAHNDRVDCDAVLVATGAAIPKFAAQVGHVIPDATPIALLARSKPFDHQLKAVLNTPNVAMRPTPDGAIVFDSAWSEQQTSRAKDGGFRIEPSTLERLVAEASKVLAGNPKIELAGYGIGFKPVPKDGEPVLGALDGIPGYFVAFTHSGATVGLISGELLAREIIVGELSPLLKNFRPGRFAQTRSPNRPDDARSKEAVG
ncbi:FAD-binding oxidoreductase [Terrarubrum flagellatum]|uniref:NAD(P)/FAD-dependent oxidoreductase n=1 Tax=Terrirubrum flagellatum TaxID=2895980 RepID=UPI0031455404